MFRHTYFVFLLLNKFMNKYFSNFDMRMSALIVNSIPRWDKYANHSHFKNICPRVTPTLNIYSGTHIFVAARYKTKINIERHIWPSISTRNVSKWTGLVFQSTPHSILLMLLQEVFKKAWCRMVLPPISYYDIFRKVWCSSFVYES